MNANRSASIATAWRICSLVVLVLWTAGMAMCAAHCALGTVRLSSVQLSCHSSSDKASACHGNDADPGESQQGSPSVCYTLKHLFADGPQLQLTIPELPVFDTAVIFEAITLCSEPVLSTRLRQQQTPEWVFTPEVSLGPALRSLAPPITS